MINWMHGPEWTQNKMLQETVALNSGPCSPSLSLPPPYQAELRRRGLPRAPFHHWILRSPPHCWSLHRGAKPLRVSGWGGGTHRQETPSLEHKEDLEAKLTQVTLVCVGLWVTCRLLQVLHIPHKRWRNSCAEGGLAPPTPLLTPLRSAAYPHPHSASERHPHCFLPPPPFCLFLSFSFYFTLLLAGPVSSSVRPSFCRWYLFVSLFVFTCFSIFSRILALWFFPPLFFIFYPHTFLSL